MIVSLQGDAREHIAELPFHTVLVRWDVGDATGPTSDAALAASQKELTHRITDLMETLRGKGAD